MKTSTAEVKARHARGSWFGPWLARVDSEDREIASNGVAVLALKPVGGVSVESTKVQNKEYQLIRYCVSLCYLMCCRTDKTKEWMN